MMPLSRIWVVWTLPRRAQESVKGLISFEKCAVKKREIHVANVFFSSTVHRVGPVFEYPKW